jgi:hypothetical protein
LLRTDRECCEGWKFRGPIRFGIAIDTPDAWSVHYSKGPPSTHVALIGTTSACAHKSLVRNGLIIHNNGHDDGQQNTEGAHC